jgi:hypothetical protein
MEAFERATVLDIAERYRLRLQKSFDAECLLSAMEVRPG